ncbi:hypothetical protein HCN44_009575 [Aphidius gifuensis]|uniref:AAA+ ATPase domain-containing protein n=1 Tax=Aphidius gifuensis TaxID=684658 RepID=A0A835CW63_APHGI|nr:hypothetical protein HCN44_009575 [Aphidius gifuensis]
MTDCLSLQGLENRMKHVLREKEEKRVQGRRKNLLYLILDYLRREGLRDSSEVLVNEAKLTPDIAVCDNIDLDSILLDYEDYYMSKFNRLPKLCKKIDNPISWFNKIKSQKKSTSDEMIQEKKRINKSQDIDDNFGMTVFQIPGVPSGKSQGSLNIIENVKIIRPIEEMYSPGSEFRDIADSIMKEIILTDLNVHWNDILGLDNCKKILQESITYPIKYPNFFCGKFSPWKGFLLYGPPGTGKTMLARAVATECNCTFFNITASSLISKWRGDSEKYIRVLCELAKHQAPSIIFIDEIDWITSDTNTSGITSEPSRRFRSELLSRLDGLISLEKTNVILLATTNSPWSLDSALLRRLEKHILVDFPDEKSRRKILEFYTDPHLHREKSFEQLIIETEYYSGSDLKQLCKEAWMTQFRKFMSVKKNISNNEKPPELISSIASLEEAKNLIYPTAKNLADKYKTWESRNNKL